MKQLPFWRSDRFFKRAISLLVIFSMTALGVSCTATSSSNLSQSVVTPINYVAVTQALGVVVIPARSSQQQEKRLQSLAAYLQQILKLPVNIQIAKNYETDCRFVGERKGGNGLLRSLNLS
ncbi:hypothetical protein [Chlorogloeopsis fritschii]|uniref:hypothetical protein n=1 Tax=Chlorogloeopsis fritschii TaxID=1124 RepID=UPI00370D58D5